MRGHNVCLSLNYPKYCLLSEALTMNNFILIQVYNGCVPIGAVLPEYILFTQTYLAQFVEFYGKQHAHGNMRHAELPYTCILL